jgi:hypothetical protein
MVEEPFGPCADSADGAPPGVASGVAWGGASLRFVAERLGHRRQGDIIRGLGDPDQSAATPEDLFPRPSGCWSNRSPRGPDIGGRRAWQVALGNRPRRAIEDPWFPLAGNIAPKRGPLGPTRTAAPQS